MLKMFLYFISFLLLALGVSFVAEMPGFILVSIWGVEYKISLHVGLLFFAASTFITVLLIEILRVFLRLPSFFRLRSWRKNDKNWQEAFIKGFVAMKMGDKQTAETYLKYIYRSAGNSAIYFILKKEIANFDQDKTTIEELNKSLLNFSETYSYAMKELFYLEDDQKKKISILKKAENDIPNDKWVREALFNERVDKDDWRGAIIILEDWFSRHIISRDNFYKDRAVLKAGLAEELEDDNPKEALNLSLEVLSSLDYYFPAVKTAAKLLSKEGKAAKAAKIIENAWAKKPNYELAEIYLSLFPKDSAENRLNRAFNLQKLQPSSRESLIIIVRTALDTRKFSIARENLDKLYKHQMARQVCLFEAELAFLNPAQKLTINNSKNMEEITLEGEALVRLWLLRAVFFFDDFPSKVENKINYKSVDYSPSAEDITFDLKAIDDEIISKNSWIFDENAACENAACENAESANVIEKSSSDMNLFIPFIPDLPKENEVVRRKSIFSFWK